MAELVSQMTKEELRRLIDDALEEKLMELFGDPDMGLEINESLRERLLKQKEAVANGERGLSLDEAAAELGL